jgi:hypothetical protein
MYHNNTISENIVDISSSTEQTLESSISIINQIKDILKSSEYLSNLVQVFNFIKTL